MRSTIFSIGSMLMIFVPTFTCTAQNPDKNQTNISSNGGTSFEQFLNTFLNDCFWGKEIDRMVVDSSTQITKYYHKEIGFGRYYNPNNVCWIFTGGGYGYYLAGIEPKPNNPNLKYFKNKKPTTDKYDELIGEDGIYFQYVEKFPDIWDMIKERLNPVGFPSKYIKNKKVKVEIQYEKSIIKTMYFVEINGGWYLTYFYDCDCSA